MVVTYAVVRSVGGLTQDDLRETAVSGTLTDTILKSGTTDFGGGSNKLIDLDGAGFSTLGIVLGQDKIVRTSDGAVYDVNNIDSDLQLDVTPPNSGFPNGTAYQIVRQVGVPGLVVVEVVSDGRGFHYIFTEEPTL